MDNGWPPLGIMLLTYAPDGSPRADYAEQTLRGALENLKYSGEIHVHIADDGSSQAYRDRLMFFAGCFANVKSLGVTNSGRGGYGANYNAATMHIHSRVGIVLPLEDDWVLQRPLDLDPLVRVLLNEPRIGMIRMGYIGYSHPLRAEFVWSEGQHFLLLDPSSPSQYVFSGGPRLETVEWARSVGPWPEGLAAGETELAVCGRNAARQRVAWPIELVGPQGHLWEHIGTHPVKNESVRAAVRA